jgi:uncharacterized damage-inducible protein DinB
MSMARNIKMLTRYTLWANKLLYAALQKAPVALLYEARPGRPSGLVGTLGHAYVVDLIWRAHLKGTSHGFKSRNLNEPMSLEALAAAQIRTDEWYVSHADAQTDSTLDEVVNFKFVDGGAGALSRGDILLHIVNHKTYHRGYIADMLYESGLRLPTIDIPVFLRDHPPQL